MALVRKEAPNIAQIIDRLSAVTHPKRTTPPDDRSARGYPIAAHRTSVPVLQKEMRSRVNEFVGKQLGFADFVSVMFDETPSANGTEVRTYIYIALW